MSFPRAYLSRFYKTNISPWRCTVIFVVNSDSFPLHGTFACNLNLHGLIVMITNNNAFKNFTNHVFFSS